MNNEDSRQLIENALTQARLSIIRTNNHITSIGSNRFGDTTLNIDLEAEKAIINEFKKSGESYTIVTEESGIVDVNGGGNIVVVDPLDGSNNAARGIPIYCISIAISQGKRLSDISNSGIMNAITGDIIYADLKGVFLNGQRKYPSNITNLNVANINMIMKLSDVSDTEGYAEKTLKLMKLVYVSRFLGCAALESAYVSIGLLDAFVDLVPRLRMVDVAASFHMARISGAYLRILNADDDISLESERRFSCIVAANEKLGMSILDVVQ
jgi:myo-inositol-1(or 4)-monophosphatase